MKKAMKAAALIIWIAFVVAVGIWLMVSWRQASPTPPASSTSTSSAPPPPASPARPEAAQAESPPPTSRVEREAAPSTQPRPPTVTIEPPIIRGEPQPEPVVPPPEPPPQAPVERPPTVTLEPLRDPPPAPTVPDPVPAVPQPSGLQVELAAVRRVLDRYRQMYNQLDASAASSIWPSVDSRELERIFARLERQELDFDGCTIALSESTATALCTGWLRYVPRVGNAELRNERHSWTIRFERTNETWKIVQVSAQ